LAILYRVAHALDHLGNVILIGGDPEGARCMGLKRADSVAPALEMEQDTVGPNPSATYMHIPPLFMCQVSWVSEPKYRLNVRRVFVWWNRMKEARTCNQEEGPRSCWRRHRR
jgi:hypothetical protein